MNENDVVLLGRALREHGVAVTPAEVVAAVAAFAVIDQADREEVFLSLRSVFTARIDDFPIFEELFFRGLVFGAFLKNFVRDRDRAKPQSLFGEWVMAHLGRTWAAWASYRGFLYRWRLPLAVVISSLMFGLLHFQGSNTFGSWFVVGTTTVIGMVLAVIRYRTGRLGMAICTHVLFNTSGLVLALIFNGS